MSRPAPAVQRHHERWLIPFSALAIDPNHELGAGAFGVVQLARYLESEVAVKRLHFNGAVQQEEELVRVMANLHREAAFMESLKVSMG
jgi:hypothetical protein